MTVAAGVWCSGGAEHGLREWCVGPDRRLVLGGALTPEVAHALKVPIPGDDAVAAVDAHRLTVLLVNGENWRLDARGAIWRPCQPATKEGYMPKDAKGSPVLLAAGSGCGVIWFATADRKLYAWNGSSGSAPLAAAPVPGSARILAVDAAQRSVVLDDGTRHQWLGGRWVRLGGLSDSAAMLRVRVLESHCMGGERGDVYAGDELDLPESEARTLIAAGRAAPVVA